MFRSYRIGTLLGFPLEVNLSFLLMLGAVVLWMGGLAALFVVLIAFGSVILHELGHALVARSLGVTVAGIELHFFGGAAKMIDPPRRAADEIAIAAAGPAVSFILGGVGMVLARLSGLYFFELFAWINLIIGAFNLIPALPMDGGRIFRALLTRKMSFLRATEISVMVARGVAIAAAVFALASMQLYLLLLAVVLWMMGSAEMQNAHVLRDHYIRGPGGYDTRGRGDVEVMPRGFTVRRRPDRDAGEPPIAPEGFASRRHYVIRQRGGRFEIEVLE